ncbi:hypothetical protein BBJ41_38275 [Burkholderia stabilis]|nr:hypothetical protein BBJ41_38275 [Burkholderia stabilis]
MRVSAQISLCCAREASKLSQAQRLPVDAGARLVLLADQIQPACVLNCLLFFLARERCTD